MKVEWENGEISHKALNAVAADDPVTRAICAKERGLLDTDGWKRFRSLARQANKMPCEVSRSKMRSCKTCEKEMCGVKTPRNCNDGIRLDKLNRNDKWQSCTKLEMDQFHECDTFHDKGVGATPGEDFKKIRVHLAHAVKHSGRHKARFCANRSLTEVPLSSTHSVVVSFKSLQTAVFLAELNGSESWATDVGNTCLEAETSEKVLIVARPKFDDLKGRAIIFEVLRSLRFSSLRWSERLSRPCLKDMGFSPSCADPCARGCAKLVILILVSALLAIASKDPAEIIRSLTEKRKFKLKGAGPIKFHLGCDFFRDKEGALRFTPHKCIDKMVASCKRMFGTHQPKTTKITPPLEKGDHPAIDNSDVLDDKGTEQHQLLIGQLQQATCLGRFDIAVAIMAMSGFRSAPREGHLLQVRQICGCLSKMRHSII